MGSTFMLDVRLGIVAWLVPASFRPVVEVNGRMTRVLVEQTAAVDPDLLGDRVGHLTLDELRHVEAALRLLLDL